MNQSWLLLYLCPFVSCQYLLVCNHQIYTILRFKWLSFVYQKHTHVPNHLAKHIYRLCCIRGFHLEKFSHITHIHSHYFLVPPPTCIYLHVTHWLEQNTISIPHLTIDTLQHTSYLILNQCESLTITHIKKGCALFLPQLESLHIQKYNGMIVFPDGLKTLSLPHNYHFSLNNLPKSLTTLDLGKWFNQICFFIPPLLQSLTLSGAYSFDLPSDLPNSLTYLKLGACFNRVIIYLPPRLLFLELGYLYSKHLHHLNLSSVRTIVLYPHQYSLLPSLSPLCTIIQKKEHV